MDPISGRCWYFRNHGEEVGPVSWTELRRLAKSGSLTPDHQVRISPDGTSGLWLPVSRISHLIPEFDQTADQQDDHHLEAEAHSALANHAAVTEDAKSRKTISWQSTTRRDWSLRPVVDTAMGFWYLLLEISDRIGKLLWKLALPGVALLLFTGINYGLWVWINTDSEQTQIEKLKRIGTRFQELNFRKGSDAEWTAFRSESLKTLEPMIPLFEKYASADRPIQQQLLWAGRDCLLPMLKTGRNADPELQARFHQHMFQIRYKILRIDDTGRMPEGSVSQSQRQ